MNRLGFETTALLVQSKHSTIELDSVLFAVFIIGHSRKASAKTQTGSNWILAVVDCQMTVKTLQSWPCCARRALTL